jgi:ABC-type nitrate/sulfonate/bicarbonate transport system permease component
LQITDIKRAWLYRVIGLAAFLLVWLVASSSLQQVNPRASTILPSPIAVFTVDLSGLSVFADGRTMNDWSKAVGVIGQQSAISLLRLVCGGLVGVIAGILTGMLIGYSPWVRALTEPVLLFIRTIPILALIPLFLVWFGGSETGNIVYIGFAVFAMVVINTIEAIRNVRPVYFQYARTLGASRFQAYRTVILPAMVPELIGGIRVVLGLSWAIVLAAEYLASQSGLGRILIMAEKWLYTGRMIVVIVLIIAYSLLLNWLFLKVAKRITRWMPE